MQHHTLLSTLSGSLEVKDTSCFGANCDGYGNIFDEGTTYLAGHFLEKISETEMKQTFQLISKTAYFHKESILHPYVQFTESKKGLVLENLHYMEILQYIEQNNFLQLQLFTINCYCWYYMLVNFLSIFTFMLFSCSLDILTSQVLLAFIKEYLVHLILHNFFIILTVCLYWFNRFTFICYMLLWLFGNYQHWGATMVQDVLLFPATSGTASALNNYGW